MVDACLIRTCYLSVQLHYENSVRRITTQRSTYADSVLEWDLHCLKATEITYLGNVVSTTGGTDQDVD